MQQFNKNTKGYKKSFDAQKEFKQIDEKLRKEFSEFVGFDSQDIGPILFERSQLIENRALQLAFWDIKSFEQQEQMQQLFSKSTNIEQMSKSIDKESLIKSQIISQGKIQILLMIENMQKQIPFDKNFISDIEKRRCEILKDKGYQ